MHVARQVHVHHLGRTADRPAGPGTPAWCAAAGRRHVAASPARLSSPAPQLPVGGVHRRSDANRSQAIKSLEYVRPATPNASVVMASGFRTAAPARQAPARPPGSHVHGPGTPKPSSTTGGGTGVTPCPLAACLSPSTTTGPGCHGSCVLACPQKESVLGRRRSRTSHPWPGPWFSPLTDHPPALTSASYRPRSPHPTAQPAPDLPGAVCSRPVDNSLAPGGLCW